MMTVLKWLLGAIAAYVILVPLGFILVMSLNDLLRPPRKGLAPKLERSWFNAGTVMLRIAEQVDEGKVSPAVAYRRLRRIERYSARRLAPMEPHEEMVLGGMSLAKHDVRTTYLRAISSPSALVH